MLVDVERSCIRFHNFNLYFQGGWLGFSPTNNIPVISFFCATGKNSCKQQFTWKLAQTTSIQCSHTYITALKVMKLEKNYVLFNNHR